MELHLQVTSYRSQPIEAENRFVFGPQGGSIGRNSANDWVLPDPQRFVSGRHAAIVCEENGEDSAYFLTDISTNGVYLNGANKPIGNGNTIQLNDGDQLRIGDYIILATLEGNSSAMDQAYVETQVDRFVGAAPSKAPVSATGFDDPTVFRPPGNTRDYAVKEAAYISEIDSRSVVPVGSDSHEPPSLDPLEFINAPELPVEEDEPHGSEPDHASSIEQYFEVPQSRVEQIPDDWDIMDQPIGNAHSTPLLDQVTSVHFGASSITSSFPGNTTGMPTFKRAGLDDDILGAFLQGAGLDPNTLASEDAAEVMHRVGKTFRVVIEGMMDVLRARASLKQEFRMDRTEIQPSGNNPLKFAANIDEALTNLLVSNVPGYMSPVNAAEEGVLDIQAHQLAMMAGLRASFEALLARFDPHALHEEFHHGSIKEGLFKGGKYRKGKHWDNYKLFYQQVILDAQDNFQTLFGEAFVRAYEEQAIGLSAAKKHRS